MRGETETVRIERGKKKKKKRRRRRREEGKRGIAKFPLNLYVGEGVTRCFCVFK